MQQPELWATNVTTDEGQIDPSANETTAGSEALKELARRFQDRVQSGRFELSTGLDAPFGMSLALSMNAPQHWKEPLEMLVVFAGATSDTQIEFWTESYAYHHMEEVAPKLWEYLCGSTLVIFKGDLKSVTAPPVPLRPLLNQSLSYRK